MNLFKGCSYQDKAKVVDGKLILSLPNAITPVVWQMDLNQAKASSLEVNDNKKDGFALVMKMPKGETIQIAPFEKKEQALRSLMAASKALSSAHGQINVQATTAAGNAQPYIVNAQGKSGFLKKAVLTLAGIFIIMLMLGYILNSSPRAPSNMTASGFDDTTAQETQAPSAADTTGVPVSADEYLKKR